MKFEVEYTVGIKEIGLCNEMTNYGFLSFLEEAACSHSNLTGYGVNDIDEKRTVWILMDWKLTVNRRPKYGKKVTIKTWARKMENPSFYTYRDFEMWCNGEKVAIATSKWVLFDLDKNKITKINDDIISLYKPEMDKVYEEEQLSKLKEEEISQLKYEYEVNRSDIDINNHMHNLNYLLLANEALPEENYRKEKQNVRIMYKHQILYKDKIKCNYSEVENKSIIAIKSIDDKTLHAIVELS